MIGFPKYETNDKMPYYRIVRAPSYLIIPNFGAFSYICFSDFDLLVDRTRTTLFHPFLLLTDSDTSKRARTTYVIVLFSQVPLKLRNIFSKFSRLTIFGYQAFFWRSLQGPLDFLEFLVFSLKKAKKWVVVHIRIIISEALVRPRSRYYNDFQ